MAAERRARRLVLVAAVLSLLACKERPSEFGAGAPALERPPALSECEENAAKSQCYRSKATETGAGGLCLFLEEKRQQADCLADVARATKDRKWCAAADAISPSSRCASDLARELKDPRVCQSIKPVDDHDRCVKDAAEAAEDASQCRYIVSPSAHDQCVQEAASRAKNLRQCALAKNPRRRDDCRRGRGALTPAACELVEDATRKSACYIDQLSYNRNDSAWPTEQCQKSGGQADVCFQRAAQNGNPSFCEHVGARSDSPARRSCYAHAFERSVDTCEGIQDPVLAQRCAISLRNVSEATCAAITDTDVADDCWAKFGQSAVAACLRIKDPDRRRLCVRLRWPQAKDPRVCAELGAPQLQQMCQTRVRLNTVR
ncbi:MAG TPA: hypothetical protein VHM25_09340 [Polyangiaceae bacterium]|nr:hypothetical protein [Polyangiaceae bacterium]